LIVVVAPRFGDMSVDAVYRVLCDDGKISADDMIDILGHKSLVKKCLIALRNEGLDVETQQVPIRKAGKMAGTRTMYVLNK